MPTPLLPIVKRQLSKRRALLVPLFVCWLALIALIAFLPPSSAQAASLTELCAAPNDGLVATAKVHNLTEPGMPPQEISTLRVSWRRCGAQGSVRNLAGDVVATDSNDRGITSSSRALPLTNCPNLCGYEQMLLTPDREGEGKYQWRSTTPFRFTAYVTLHWTDADGGVLQLLVPVVVGRAPVNVATKASSRPLGRTQLVTVSLSVSKQVAPGLRVCAKTKGVKVVSAQSRYGKRAGRCISWAHDTRGVRTLRLAVRSTSKRPRLSLVVSADGAKTKTVAVKLRGRAAGSRAR